MNRTGLFSGVVLILAVSLLTLFLGGPPLLAQGATDTNGMINTSQWLIVGPFSEPFGCNGNDDSILANHIAPSCIGCQYPEEDDEIDYNPGEAAANYVGPTGGGGGPVWRAFDDGGDDGDQNLDADVNGDQSSVMSWLATYIEYTGDAAAVVELCVGSDDGVQVWLDGTLVHNYNACRARGVCQDTAGVLIEKGVHRFAIGTWENGGGWGCSLGMRINGVPIVDDGTFSDWTFLGRIGGAALKSDDCECQDPVVVKPRVLGVTCFPNAQGGIDLAWTNPDDADPAVPITIYLNGAKQGTVDGDATSFEVKAADLPGGAASFCIVNDSGLPACCDTRVTTDTGFIKSNHWLMLGPFRTVFGCNNNQDSIRGNHIAPSRFDCEYPKQGDEIEYDAELAVSEDYVGPLGPNGKPYWRVFDDGSSNEDIDLDRDVGGDLSDVASFLATYVEYLGDTPIDIQLCVGSDDGVQVWINGEIAHSNNACRGRAACQDVVPATIRPGISRIILGVWERAGGWGGSLALQMPDGTPIIDDGSFEDWVFYGAKTPPNLPSCAVLVTRDVPGTLVNGTSGTVTLALEPRTVQGVVVINEVMLPGLTASNPSNGGIVNADTVTWNLGKVDKPLTISYTLTAAQDAEDGDFPSTATVDGQPLIIFGDSYTGAPMTSEGFIKHWNHLGPFAFIFPVLPNDHGPPGSCDGNSGVDLVLDWILNKERSIGEPEIFPFPGLVTRPDYGAAARAAGVVIEGGDSGDVVQDRYVVWKGSSVRRDTVDHNSSFVHGFDADDHMTLSCTYVTNNTAGDIAAQVAFGSDDAIQIFVNEADVTGGGILECRPYGAPGEIQNTAPAVLKTGENRVLVKVADGGGTSGFRLRFQDDAGVPLLSPAISISFESKSNPLPGEVSRSLESSTYGLSQPVGVSLSLDMNVASDVKLREVLPEGAAASAISDGGSQAGNEVVWNLTGVTQKTVTYQIMADACAGMLAFSGSTFQVGASEAVVGGANLLTRIYQNDNLGVWSNTDINSTGGSAQKMGAHQVSIAGSGDGVRQTQDQFHFVSHAASGDFAFTARLDCMDDPARKGSAGIVVRASEEPGAANIHLYLIRNRQGAATLGTLKGTLRRDLGKSTSLVTISDKDVAALPVWLQVRRAGTTLSLLRSPDGATFTEVASRESGPTGQVNLPDGVLIGLGVASGGSGLTTASFSNVSGPEFAAGPQQPLFRRGDLDSSGTVDISDPVILLGSLFLGGGEPECLEAGDFDDNGVLDITDAVNNLGYQFLGGAAPPDPGPTVCGPDKNLEVPDLGCKAGCR